MAAKSFWPWLLGGGAIAYFLLRDDSSSGGSSNVSPVTRLPQTTPPWLPIVPPIVVSPSSWSAALNRRALLALDVVTAPRYRQNQQGHGETYCNIFVWDGSKALGVEIPHVVGGKEQNANGVAVWMATTGLQVGWREVDLASAWTLANRGIPAVSMWNNPGGTGHMSFFLPRADGNAAASVPRIVQAGAANLADATMAAGWGTVAKPHHYVFG